MRERWVDSGKGACVHVRAGPQEEDIWGVAGRWKVWGEEKRARKRERSEVGQKRQGRRNRRKMKMG